MKKFSQWLDKKKTDQRFKKAGAGRTLADADTKPRPTPPASAAAPVRAQSRERPPEGNSAAAAAALARFEKKKEETAMVTPRVFSGGANAGSVSLDEDLARLQMQKNAMHKARMAREKAATADEAGPAAADSASEPKPVSNQRTAKLYFRCPDGVIVEESQVRHHLVRLLEDNFAAAEEPVMAAIELIYTACESEQQCTTCVNTLGKFIGNVRKDPAEPKYRKIRLSNEMVRNRVASVPGAVDLLRAVGFEDETIDGEPHLVLGDDAAALLAVGAEEVLAVLGAGEPATAEFSHNPQVVSVEQSAKSVALPESFYAHSKADVQTQAVLRVSEKNEELTLRTQEMRDKNIAAKKTYRFALIRVRFPDKRVVQATFRVTDTVGKVAEVVSECLTSPAEFTLHHPGAAPSSLDDHTRTLLDANLAPSSLLNISFRDAANAPVLRSDLPLLDA